MKRRTFIITATAAAVAVISTPILCNQISGKKHFDPLIMPKMLGSFCDEKTVRGIGVIYRKQVPEEGIKKNLASLLLVNNGANPVSPSDESEIIKLLDRKIHEDFLGNRIVVLKGWVISITEARQCALFSLT